MTGQGVYKYKAFISYSHKDDPWAKWLHRRLENYRLPKSTINTVPTAQKVKHPLRPIFRDREDLAAANDLGDKIEQALTQSENLIVICSPQAAQSQWVNEEILYFKRQNRTAQIFTIIVDGEPYASHIAGREAEEAFPPALRFQLNSAGELSTNPAEPLAADMRGHADGKRLGFLKLISGLLNVGLDEIVQRDMQRNRRRVTTITSSALATILVMGTLTGFALYARQDAEQQRSIAQARTTSAEELIEFMVTDLKVKLNAVGRLDALQVVGEEASSYYDQYQLSSHDDDALGRRARVFHFLGEIQANTGELDIANNYFERAYESTQALLSRAPNNADRIFDHAQSAFWLTHVPHIKGKYDSVEVYYKEYAQLADRLLKQEPDTLRAVQEKIYANGNLASIAHLQGRNNLAYELYKADISYTQKVAAKYSDNIDLKMSLTNSYAWAADAAYKGGRVQESINYREEQYKILTELKQEHPQNADFHHRSLTSALSLTGLHLVNNDIGRSKTLLGKSLTDSAELWSSDKKNTQWLGNYIAFILRQALIANCENDTKTADKAIALYDRIKSGVSIQNSDIASIFGQAEDKYNTALKKYAPTKHIYKGSQYLLNTSKQ
ncbi:MAG: toll/interleukin-1 receptor domain-containing protein [Litorimonas sp.]